MHNDAVHMWRGGGGNLLVTNENDRLGILKFGILIVFESDWLVESKFFQPRFFFWVGGGGWFNKGEESGVFGYIDDESWRDNFSLPPNVNLICIAMSYTQLRKK